MEKWIRQQEIHRARIFSLWGGEVLLDNGETAVREYIRHGGGVGLVPVLDGDVILSRQFRIAIERELLELPAGRLEPGEDPLACAARELEEESGCRAGRLYPARLLLCLGGQLQRTHAQKWCQVQFPGVAQGN